MTTTKDRRAVAYQNLEELRVDAQQRAVAQSPTLGNWSMGQIFEHLARTMDKSIDGFEATTPFYIRWGAQLFLKKKFLRDGLPAGFQLKGKGAEEMVPGETSIEDGLAHLQRAIDRLAAESKRSPHPAFGKMDVDQWQQMHLRHSELHMSFIAD